jgi:DNA polymerase III delta subunit
MVTTMSSAKPPVRPVPKVDKRQKFHFLYGDDEAGIEGYKHAIVEAHLSPDEREENYREIVPSGSPPTLKRVLGDLISELSTVSFLPDVSRVVTLYTVNDFFDGKAAKPRGKKAAATAEADGKRTASEHFAQFLKEELPKLPAVLIVIVVEDYEKWKRVSTSNPVVAMAIQSGGARQFKEDSPQFAFFDALFARQPQKALTLWREWLRRAPGSPKPYMQLAAQMRLLLQAKTAVSGQLQSRGVTKQRFIEEFMPGEQDKNLFALRPDWRQEKMTKAAANFSFQELLSAYERLMPLQKYAIPMNSDPWVPDKPLLAELWILEFASPAGRQAA